MNGVFIQAWAELLNLKFFRVRILGIEQNLVVLNTFAFLLQHLGAVEGKEGAFFGCASHNKKGSNRKSLRTVNKKGRAVK